MALYKICPTCKTENDPQEMMCKNCLGDISGISPSDSETPASSEPKEPPPTQSAEPPLSVQSGQSGQSDKTVVQMRSIRLISQEGMEIIVRENDIVGRRSVGEEALSKYMTISRRHARFSFTEGIWHIEDMGSTNGTFVDGIRIRQGERMPIECDTKIALSSSVELTVKVDSNKLSGGGL